MTSNKFLSLLLTLIFFIACQNASASNCEEYLAMRSKESITKLLADDYKTTKYNDSHSIPLAYEGVVSAILNGENVCMIGLLIEEYENINSLGVFDINASNKDGFFPLSAAAFIGNLDIMELLLTDPKVDINNTSSLSGTTALMAAAFEGHKKIVERLLDERGIDINAQDKYGMTALMFAAEQGHEDAVEKLLDEPQIDIMLKNNDGKDAFRIACDKVIDHSDKHKLLDIPADQVYIDRYIRVIVLLEIARNDFYENYRPNNGDDKPSTRSKK